MSAKTTNANGDSPIEAPGDATPSPHNRCRVAFWSCLAGIVVTFAPITGKVAVAQAAPVTQAPRAAVARIVVQETGGVAYGSGALVDARGEFGLVVTNWHVVRDATGPIEVVFPSGFRSEARRLKLDEDWDLAALVIWRPPASPLPLAATAPRPGDRLTICGYGAGQYREATGRCTDYYAPEIGLPHELVELSVEARQGDSGGPILNDAGEIAGVLFGAGQGTTLGSFGGRVGTFLASLAPNIGGPRAAPLIDPLPSFESEPPGHSQPPLVALNAPPANPPTPPWRLEKPVATSVATSTPAPSTSRETLSAASPGEATQPATDSFAPWDDRYAKQNSEVGLQSPDLSAAEKPVLDAVAPQSLATQASQPVNTPVVASVTSEAYAAPAPSWFDEAKSIFAIVGLIFVLLQLVRLVT